MHIDLLQRARGQGVGRRMMEQLMDELHKRGSPGAHLAVSVLNTPGTIDADYRGEVGIMRVNHVLD